MRYVCPECGDGGDGPGPCPADGTARAPVGSDPLLGTTIGSWRVARILGAGGMGRVYVAVQPQIGARVAIKVLKRESAASPDVVERFFNEARAVNLIKHEAIVDVIDLGRLPDGSPYIVMEYLDGASLGAIVRRDKRLPLGTLARIVGDVLAALEAAHAKGIIHRDLKPDNVFVSPSGRVTVLDFGVAKLAAGDGLDATQTGSLLGTPAYMSPEQARTQPLDARADLYAVGVMLYEASTGALPFTAPNLFDLLQMHVTTPPKPPRELAPEIPEALEAVILRALEKDPAKRFRSAAEMRRALAASVEGLPQLALASIEMPREAAIANKPSDPFAATAASTGASIATDETQASTPPAPRSEPAKPTHLQLSRGLLFALLGAAALLGLGGAALVLFLANRQPATHEPVAENPPPVPLPMPTPEPTDAQLPGDADVAVIEPADAAAVRHGPPVTRDASVVASSPGDAPQKRIIRASNTGFPDVPGEIGIPHPEAFDVFAFYKLALAHARKLGGASVQLTAMRVRNMNRAGLVDLTTNGSFEIFFISPERAKAEEPCFFLFLIEDGAVRFGLGENNATDGCRHGFISPPRCPPAELWKRAEAHGLPPGTQLLTLNRFPHSWQMSDDGDWSEPIDDDCP